MYKLKKRKIVNYIDDEIIHDYDDDDDDDHDDDDDDDDAVDNHLNFSESDSYVEL